MSKKEESYISPIGFKKEETINCNPQEITVNVYFSDSKKILNYPYICYDWHIIHATKTLHLFNKNNKCIYIINLDEVKEVQFIYEDEK